MNANSDSEYIDNKVGDILTSLDDLRTTMNERFDALRTTMDERFKAADAKLEAMAAKIIADVIKWVVGLFVTMIALTVGLVSIALNLILRMPLPAAAPVAPVPVVSTPSVIIQLTPQGATVLPAAPAGERKP
ncbi:hypothetical protein SAMN05192549_10136 [Duganella sacchari]|uniref:Uncharacterized protein n=1 Tax=Duganella sacchari TaxID=551987 RepID=A0A1M7H245_9BURK|nr:hypothetical protein [Duganella sacchari]SHM22675.1 hypothetical protein SAMN05192549_10136 [Duganella sacchari]